MIDKIETKKGRNHHTTACKTSTTINSYANSTFRSKILDETLGISIVGKEENEEESRRRRMRIKRIGEEEREKKKKKKVVDWKETPESHIFKADLPGLKKEEVKVEVEEGGVLQISGDRSVEKENKNDKWHRVERGRGKFSRRFWLPENAKVDQVKASMENGVLTVTVPKMEEKKPQVKSIEITG